MRNSYNIEKMNNSSRVILNTSIVYIQLIVNTILGLFITRFILQALGEEDYGIYMLVAGVVTMLNVLNSSMSNTAMRYMGHSLGSGDIENTKKTFATTMNIHFFLGGLMILVLEIGGWVMFGFFLNIPEAKLFSAKVIYQFMIVTTFISIISVPFDAVINAHENMLFFSLMNILECVLKLLLAVFLLLGTGDLLIVYGFFTMVIGVVMRIIKQIYCTRHYEEVTWKIKVYKDKGLTKSILSFTGWELFASLAAICQGQLRSVLMNMFFGVKINAAEGIGSRVNTQVNMVSIGVTRAITPQMNKAEGAENRQRMLFLAKTGIKFTTFIFSLLAVPFALEAKFILGVWLVTVPEYAVIFCQFALALQLLDKLTWQIGNAIRAAGRIKEYQIVSGSLPIIGIVVSFFVFNAGYSPVSAYVVEMCMLCVMMLVRFGFGKWLLNLSPMSVIKEASLPVVIPMILSFILVLIVHQNMVEGWFRLLIVFSIFMSTYTIVFYVFGITKDERMILQNIVNSLLAKIRSKY